MLSHSDSSCDKEKSHHFFKWWDHNFAGVTGLEPATHGFGSHCSTKLSYTPISNFHYSYTIAQTIFICQEENPKNFYFLWVALKQYPSEYLLQNDYPNLHDEHSKKKIQE